MSVNTDAELASFSLTLLPNGESGQWQGKHVLCQIDAKSHNSHGLPLSSELMRVRPSHRGTQLPFAAMRLARDGEVPFIR
jgi:hypothetical protein